MSGKRCSIKGCKETNPKAFSRNRCETDGLSSHCKQCVNKAMKRYRRTEKGSKYYAEYDKRPAVIESKRRRQLKRLYNIDAKQDKALGNKCGICKRVCIGYERTIDHDHNCCPGEICCGNCIRGVLCRKCNLMLGHAGDSIRVLKKAITYLRSNALGG